MFHNTDDLRIREIKELYSPALVMQEFPCVGQACETVYTTRKKLHQILNGEQDHLIIVIGPCSIHDTHAALEYAGRLKLLAKRFKNELLIIMRVYFEKPRTTVGWKGLINDPDLDSSFDINKGISVARKLLLEINQLGVAAGCEFLDMVTPQYIADLVSWGAVGARTTESQVHRELASGLSCPVGFKNGTDGNVKIAIDAIKAASQPHHFLSVTKGGVCAIVSTTGNQDCHIILRGGKVPNYDAASIDAACQAMTQSNLSARVMVDVSHANSHKRPENQPQVVANVACQIESGDSRIIGLMIESHLLGGRQELIPGQPLTYGQSITDGCIDWSSSVKVLEQLAHAVQKRRLIQGSKDSKKYAA